MNDLVRCFLVTAALALLSLTACGQGPEATLLGTDSIVADTITGWNHGTGYSFNVYMWKPGQKDRILVASSPVSAQGGFTFQLPPEDEVRQFLRSDYLRVKDTACSQVPTIVPAELRFAPVGLKIEKSGFPTLQPAFRNYADIFAAPPDYSNGEFVFSEAEGQGFGQIDCPGDITPGTYDLHIMRGWNLIFHHLSHFSGPSNDTRVVVNSEPPSGGCKWYAQ